MSRCRDSRAVCVAENCSRTCKSFCARAESLCTWGRLAATASDRPKTWLVAIRVALPCDAPAVERRLHAPSTGDGLQTANSLSLHTQGIACEHDVRTAAGASCSTSAATFSTGKHQPTKGPTLHGIAGVTVVQDERLGTSVPGGARTPDVQSYASYNGRMRCERAHDPTTRMNRMRRTCPFGRWITRRRDPSIS